MQSRKRGVPPATAKSPAVEKSGLHPRNVHRTRYDFAQLCAVSPELAAFVARNAYGDESINFADPAAVKALNRALLQQHYNIRDWDIPPHYLCPPIPGRVDYLHYVADLLAEMNGGVIPQGAQVRVLDIGTGANCIYPLLGTRVYGWQFVGADVDVSALANAQRVVDANGLGAAITLRRQTDPAAIFSGIVQAGEVFDLTLCNPPFHASLAEAQAGTQRKWRNLGKAKQKAPLLNFGGQNNELYCTGGEAAFVRRMIEESAQYKNNCLWFSTLVSKAENLPLVYRALKQAGVVQQRTMEMAQGQKQSRVVAWSYLDGAQQQAWRNARWREE